MSAIVSSSSPRTLRLFNDDGLSFVMVDELKAALQGTVCPQDPDMDFFTVSETVARGLIAQSGQPVELINTNIPRSSTTSLLLKGPNGNPCKLAIDVLLELIISISVSNIASHSKRTDPVENMKEVGIRTRNFVNKIQEHFPTNKKSPFFISEQKIDLLHQIAKETFEESSEEEIKCKERIDRTVVEMIMLPCFVKTYPNMALFIHNQNGCDRLSSKCCCPKKVPVTTSEVSTFENSAPKHQKNKTKKAKKVKKVVEVSEVPETAPEVQELAITPEEPQFPVKPAHCQNCLKTSNQCNTVKLKLKESQNNIKRVQKKQTNTEKELSDVQIQLEKSEEERLVQAKIHQEKMDALRKQVEELRMKNAGTQI